MNLFKLFYKNSKKQETQKKQETDSAKTHMFKDKQRKTFKVTQQNDNSFKVELHQTYTVKQGQKHYEQIQTYVFLANEKNQHDAGKIKQKFGLEYFPSFQFDLAKCKMQEEKCTICLQEFQIKTENQLLDELDKENQDDVYVLACSHKFHIGCLKNLIGEKHWAKCPVCSTIFGTMTGDQPDGKMDVTVNQSMTLPGHGKGAIIINYYMSSGRRNGVNFAGTSRTAYLPDNKEGREVLELLRQAFNRKLIFTVGRSVTTGLDNQTVWNGIHHKTSTTGGASHFGYPDPTYLDRVKQELAAKGVTLASLKKQ